MNLSNKEIIFALIYSIKKNELLVNYLEQCTNIKGRHIAFPLPHSDELFFSNNFTAPILFPDPPILIYAGNCNLYAQQVESRIADYFNTYHVERPAQLDREVFFNCDLVKEGYYNLFKKGNKIWIPLDLL
jgi:hypothetical protein